VRFLVDNALSQDVSRGLSAAADDVLHVRDVGLGSADDSEILDRAAADDRTVTSADIDFGTLLALRQESEPSVVLFRGATPRRPLDQVALLLANLARVEDDLLAGAIVIIQPARILIRSSRESPNG
jgi:predicted nuclease of predicted toxin-antitoxin system